jgi:hypothetical protein
MLGGERVFRNRLRLAIERSRFVQFLFRTCQDPVHSGFPKAELTGNSLLLSGTLERKPQNLPASLGSEGFSTLVFAG